MSKSAEKKQNTGDPKATPENVRPGFKGHANVTQSRLNDGGDMAWKGKRALKGNHGHKSAMDY